MKIKHCHGFTLIELLFTLGLIALLMNIALPSFEDFINRIKIKTEVNQLRSILQLARKTAITLSKKVTVCPTVDGKQCSKNWSKGYIVFVDENEDRQYDDVDKIVHQYRQNNANITLRWRAFGVRNSLQWHQTGITNHQNGSFEYCFKDKPQLARGLFITKAGRIRKSKDSNGDGIHENAVGNNISC